jgi:hypothetical protein
MQRGSTANPPSVSIRCLRTWILASSHRALINSTIYIFWEYPSPTSSSSFHLSLARSSTKERGINSNFVVVGVEGVRVGFGSHCPIHTPPDLRGWWEMMERQQSTGLFIVCEGWNDEWRCALHDGSSGPRPFKVRKDRWMNCSELIGDNAAFKHGVFNASDQRERCCDGGWLNCWLVKWCSSQNSESLTVNQNLTFKIERQRDFDFR